MKTRPWIDRSQLERPSDLEALNAIAAASSILFSLTGQRYPGLWTTTEQYTCETTGAPVGCAYDTGVGGYWNPAVGAYTYVLDKIPGPRRAGPGGDIRLRNYPVTEITEVIVNGEVVDPSHYTLRNRRILRLNPSSPWGLCSSPVVTYTYGANPPVMGQIAARRLANEFVKAFNGEECSLPSGTTSVSRQGISLQIFDPQDFFKEGFTGIYEVDLFLKSVNPSRAMKRPRVITSDQPRGYRLP